jgi:biotin-(acetyl-CoA carboxylase) ligase
MNFLVDHGFNARLKWPNDIYIGSGKIAGVLSEASWQGDFCNRFFSDWESMLETHQMAIHF